MSVLIGMLAAAVVVGGPGYAEADKRAIAYDANVIGTAYDSQILAPVLQKADLIHACANRLRIALNKDTPAFHVVISFKDGVFAEALLDNDTPFSRCVAERVSNLNLPKAPIADYAERLAFRFE
jgi:hypothetical protein